MDATFETAPLVTDIFRPMIEGRYDVAELGLTYFLRTFDPDDPRYLALPIMPNRNFRHSAVFVNTASSIRTPQDLAGRTIGEFALYGHDPGVWVKGILAEEYGVTPEQCRWVIGGTNHPIPAFDWLPQPVPAGVDVCRAPERATLDAMLKAGEIDALISVDVPQSVMQGSPRTARLFPDYDVVERDYFRRTGIFPPMHIVAIRTEVAQDPDVVRAVYRAFCEAKDLAAQRYLDEAVKQHMGVMTPWFSKLFADNRSLFGDDWWPYGVKANRKAVDTFLRYHYEQGLSGRLLTCEDIFVPELLAV
ncbi:4,5-dihydroxyphthalate decarboxylase [Catenulispora acidiphila DSM 44928]|uniref:4,5-dihydroxyphthalate decarboxylase n=1 Tax=Catenulispora acidiphila (strain DSM 44928 / JCM 14897 / NBRC 102108 / NRRL B-24433 / ID139908) TaxID=479433 RepID=C7QEV4_CATAD|nr:4,5-dihydroxyphthalate decarboxylase [Catenulispora acidiphila]ACU72874.1 4,5-dihydroxyphthalate decarboxylase [Catenulispora acidiphila DSM 44928]